MIDGYSIQELPRRFHPAAERSLSWMRAGAFWGGASGFVLAPLVSLLPGMGLMAMAWPAVAALVGLVVGAVVVGSVSAAGAALTRIAVSKSR